MRKNRGNKFFYQYILYLCSTILTLIDMKPKLSQLFNKHSARDIFSAASVFASVLESVLMYNEKNITANQIYPGHGESFSPEVPEKNPWS